MDDNSKKLVFFVNIDKLTEELILQEGSLISLKIPKQWQKPDANIDNPALWVCHLPTNSLGIVYVSLYPTELVIKKISDEYSKHSEKDLKELGVDSKDYLIVYKGTLEPNGENDKEKFYRCHLKEQTEPKTSEGQTALIVFIIVMVVIVGIVIIKKG